MGAESEHPRTPLPAPALRGGAIERGAGRIFVVDDEELPRELIARALGRAGFEVEAFATSDEVIRALADRGDQVDLILTDLDMPEMSGHELLGEVRAGWPDIVTVVVTGATELSSAVAAMRAGAYDYLVKPVDPANTLLPAVERALERKQLVAQNWSLRRQLSGLEHGAGLVGDSPALQDVLAAIAAVAPTDATVLLTGETGTGKELVARALHQQSRRSGRAFVAINCGALAENVLESELFGHARGAFTGAVGARRGLFEEASGGTLFLDEVGELAAATQVRLLRVLQEGQVRPVGANKSVSVDARIIAATNRDLAAEVEQGSFRKDLYYRLDVIRIELPPLRARAEDVPALAQHFLAKRSERLGKAVKFIDDAVLARLARHPWPGNVRELENALDRAIVLAKGDTITVDLLPAVLREGPAADGSDDARFRLPLAEAKAAFERDYVKRLLERAPGSPLQAARLAGLDPSNFRRLLKRLGHESDSDD
jgi:two-component system, NtrC family, response regulator HydG